MGRSIQVIYERDERGWWVASSPDVPGCHTQGRSLRQTRGRMREALSLFLDNAKEVGFEEEVRLPGHATIALHYGQQARQRAEEVQEEAQHATSWAANVLTDAVGLSLRDTAELLGLSHQRVHQNLQAEQSRHERRLERRHLEILKALRVADPVSRRWFVAFEKLLGHEPKEHESARPAKDREAGWAELEGRSPRAPELRSLLFRFDGRTRGALFRALSAPSAVRGRLIEACAKNPETSQWAQVIFHFEQSEPARSVALEVLGKRS